VQFQQLKWIYRAWRCRFRLEPEVFRGARRLLTEAGPRILFECERRDLGQFDPEVHLARSGAPGYVNNFLFLKPSGRVSGAGA